MGAKNLKFLKFCVSKIHYVSFGLAVTLVQGWDRQSERKKSLFCRRIARALISHFLMQASAHEATANTNLVPKVLCTSGSCKDPMSTTYLHRGKERNIN